MEIIHGSPGVPKHGTPTGLKLGLWLLLWLKLRRFVGGLKDPSASVAGRGGLTLSNHYHEMFDG